ncbi:hypothetical protein AEGHOMDF_4108 [Methylobacterium soli]|nr:hypothetical protein AEGHOMDF_4108 [Methylobacterium soli]
MPMTACNPLPLPISTSIWRAGCMAANRNLQPVKLGPGNTVWPARLILELAANGVARAG